MSADDSDSFIHPKIIGFAPEPEYEWGLYHYACICPEPNCGWRDESDKGMLGPENAYQRHWQLKHKGEIER